MSDPPFEQSYKAFENLYDKECPGAKRAVCQEMEGGGQGGRGGGGEEEEKEEEEKKKKKKK
jgi:hypothetical protein